jgi:sugar lactone lactonase YvrE
MRYFIIPLLAISSSFSTASETKVPSLEFLWETAPIFSFAESAVYDAARSVIYISNIGETPKDNPRNGDGHVSILGLDGKLIEKHYITGLNDPKGMDISGDTLWVNDRDAIVEWDLQKNALIKRYELDNIVYLNDIGVGPDGAVYSNDADGHKVLTLQDGQWEVFWDNTEKQRPNGIWVEADRILLAMNWSHQLIAMDRETKEQTLLLDEIGAGDGIEALGNGDYLVTDFHGRVFYLSPEGKGSVIMDSREHQLTADLDYIKEQNLVIIPRHKNNSVAAYRLVWE